MGATSSTGNYPTITVTAPSSGGQGLGGIAGSAGSSGGGSSSSGGIGCSSSNQSNLLLPNSYGLSLASSSGAGSGTVGIGGSYGGSTNPNLISGVLGSSSGASHYREQRRKRVTGFATLKRKFIRKRRSSKACDHARILRDFVSDWTPLELAALCEEYEALAALRDLSVSFKYS